MEPKPGVFDADEKGDYVRYAVELRFDHWLMGGIPKRPEVIEGWLRSKAGITDTVEVEQAVLKALRDLYPHLVLSDMTYAQAVEATREVAELHVNSFVRNEKGGLCMEARQVKAMLKEAINIRFAREKMGPTGKGGRNYLAERVFVEPRLIPLGVTEPSGRHLFIGHVSAAGGERSTLTYYDYVDAPQVRFLVKVQGPAEAELAKRWPLIWVTAQNNGWGALRSQGFGTFKVVAWSRQ